MNKRKLKYIFLDIKVQNGEYEYRVKSVSEMPEEMTAEDFANDYAKTFYGNYSHSDGDDHYFNGGEVAVSNGCSQGITPEEYETLKRFI